MNVDNFIVRPARQWVERFRQPAAWGGLDLESAGEAAVHLAGLPSAVVDNDENAKRFDLLLLRMQLTQLDGDVVGFERLRLQVQDIANALLTKANIPSVAAQVDLIDAVVGDDWWVDVTLPMLELVRRRLRALLGLLDRAQKATVYVNFKDELGEDSIIELPGVSVGTDWERFKAKTRAYLKDHEDNLALQRLRRNRQLTNQDVSALEQILVDAGAGEAQIAKAASESQGLGLFIRSLSGLEASAAADALSEYLDSTKYTIDQVRFVGLIVEELTANGTVEAKRLFEPPYTDDAPQGALSYFEDPQVDGIVQVLNDVRANANPASTVA